MGLGWIGFLILVWVILKLLLLFINLLGSMEQSDAPGMSLYEIGYKRKDVHLIVLSIAMAVDNYQSGNSFYESSYNFGRDF